MASDGVGMAKRYRTVTNRVNFGPSCDPSDLTAVQFDVSFTRGPRATGLPRLVLQSVLIRPVSVTPCFAAAADILARVASSIIRWRRAIPLCASKFQVHLRWAHVHMSRSDSAERQGPRRHVSTVDPPACDLPEIARSAALDVPKPVSEFNGPAPMVGRWAADGAPGTEPSQGDSQL